MVDLHGFRHKEFGFWLAGPAAVHTLLESVAVGLDTGDGIDAVVSATLRHEVLGIIQCWDELLAVDTEFHKITYR